MDISRKITLVAVVLLALALTACARTVTLESPDGSATEMPADEYRAQQQEKHLQAVTEKLSGMIQDCPADMTEKEASECRWSNAMTMVLMPQIAQEMTSDGYWQYKGQRRQFWLQVANLAVNNPFMQALAYGSLGGSSGGKTELNFGNRVAKGGGSSDREGGGSVTSASGDTEFNDLYFTIGDKSPFQYGDGTLASGKDSQIQLGDGVQGQVFSRPFNQPGIATEGGEVNNDSQGLTGNEGDIGL